MGNTLINEVEKKKEDGKDFAEFLKEVPDSQKREVFLMVNSFNLGVETERNRRELEQRGA